MCLFYDVCDQDLCLTYVMKVLTNISFLFYAQAKPTVTETSSAASNDPWVCDEASGVPPLFLSGCVGNVTAAREKWARVREWRRKFEIDQVRAFFNKYKY